MPNRPCSGTAIALLALGTACMAACTSPLAASVAPATDVAAAGSCIDTRLIKKQKIVSDQDIQFEMQNGDVWANHLDRRCPGLNTERAFAWNLHTNRVCSNRDVIHVLNGASCTLGEFTKLPPAT